MTCLNGDDEDKEEELEPDDPPGQAIGGPAARVAYGFQCRHASEGKDPGNPGQCYEHGLRDLADAVQISERRHCCASTCG